MKFSAGIRDVDAFREMLKALAIGGEATLVFTAEGIASKMMDDKHVALVEWRLDKEMMEGYEFEEGTKITLELETLLKFIDAFSKDDPLQISIDAGRLHMKGRSTTKTERGTTQGRFKSFYVPLLDLEDEEVPKPKIFFKSRARIISGDFVEALKDASLVGEFSTISVEEGSLTIDATGDLGRVVNVWERGADDLIELKLEEPSSATFTTETIRAIASQGARCGEVMTFELSSDMPIHLIFEMEHGQLEYHIAPCIGVK